MISYFGDFAEDDTVLMPFNTFSSDDPSASVTITNLADADIKVHKDGGTTQIATDGATVAIDFDSITGNHLITIDTSAHADYATGSEYAVRIEGTTVDGATINAWVGAFSIERAGGVLALIKAGNLSANVVQLGGDAQSLTDLKDFADAGYDPATNKVQGVVLVDTTTANTDMRGTDGANTTTPLDAAGVRSALGMSSANLDTQLSTIAGYIDTEIAAILVDTGTTLDGKLDTLVTNVASILGDTGTDGVALSDAQKNSIADFVLRRSLSTALASGDGDTKAFRSLAGAVSKLVNRVAVSGSTLTVYEPNDTTALGTQALTTDASADPITEANTN